MGDRGRAGLVGHRRWVLARSANEGLVDVDGGAQAYATGGAGDARAGRAGWPSGYCDHEVSRIAGRVPGLGTDSTTRIWPS